MTGILEFRDVRFSYPNAPEALAGITTCIGKGEKVAIVGPNGAGKTTFILLCNGTLRPTGGTVLFSGFPMTYTARGLREVRRTIGIVFQNSDAQLFAPTVYQDVAFGPLNLGVPQDDLPRIVGEALHAVGLTGYERRPPHQLSGGEKKRVAIAGILAMEPGVIILDEPTGSLDPATAEEILDLLEEIHLQGRTVIVSTHDAALAHRFATRILLLEEGKVVREGPPREIFSDTAALRRARLTAPPLFELHEELVHRSLLGAAPPPSGLLDLADRIERAVRGEVHRSGFGTIYLADAGETDAATLIGILAGGQVQHFGAMGSRAKLAAKDMHLSPDFTYGVIDKCLLAAMNGKSSLILTAGGMVPHTRMRIEAYGKESSALIPLVTVQKSAPRDPVP